MQQILSCLSTQFLILLSTRRSIFGTSPRLFNFLVFCCNSTFSDLCEYDTKTIGFCLFEWFQVWLELFLSFVSLSKVSQKSLLLAKLLAWPPAPPLALFVKWHGLCHRKAPFYHLGRRFVFCTHNCFKSFCVKVFGSICVKTNDAQTPAQERHINNSFLFASTL